MARCDYCAKLTISRLVDLAKVEFSSNYVPEQAFYHHHASLADLESSAMSGCDLCTLIFDTLRGTPPHDPDLHDWRQWVGPATLEAEDSMLGVARELSDTNIKIFIDSEHLWSGESLDKVQVFDALRIHVGVPEKHASHFDCAILILFTSPTNECIVDGFRIGRIQREPDLTSEANFDLARRWLNTCRNEHTDCLKDCTPDLPTRVLDVEAKNGDQNIRLVTTRGRRGAYVALSHCWGGQVSPLLLTDNIDRFEDVIRFQELPLTFQDVVSITRELNIRYLWIDSLCIIQNSKTDWEQESKAMCLYYGNSTLTIYASSANSSTSGIFQRDGPPPLLAGPTPVYLDLFAGTESSQQIKVQALNFEDESLARLDLHGPLSSRGWTLQELILAPRHLHFGKRQIYWECIQGVRSADGLPAGPRTPFPTYPSLVPALFGSILANPTKAAGSTEEVLPDYYQLVRTYTSRQLTYPSDKLPAFGGFAQRIHAAVGGHYLAGLWSCDLHRSLVWYAEMVTCRPVSGYRAPSWSWAVTDEPVIFADQDFQSDAFKLRLIDHDMTLGDPTNPYGQVKGGYLRVRGFVKSLYNSLQIVNREPIDYGIYYDDPGKDLSHRRDVSRSAFRAIIDGEDCVLVSLAPPLGETDRGGGEEEDVEINFDMLLPGKYTILLIGTYKHRDNESLMMMASGLILQELDDGSGKKHFKRAGLLPRITFEPGWLLTWEERTLEII